eukprot:Hpha_TRINITY_DN12796_c0_g2::TRINITY_DN12796_c0_g2_i1::g.114313::m.114313
MTASADLQAALRSVGQTALQPKLLAAGIEDAETLSQYTPAELAKDGVVASFAARKRVILAAKGQQLPPPPHGTLEGFLKDAQLSQYLQGFRSSGVEGLQLLASCDEGDLEELGVKLGGHRKKIRARLGVISPATSPTGPGTPPPSVSPAASPTQGRPRVVSVGPSYDSPQPAGRARTGEPVDDLENTHTSTSSSQAMGHGRGGYSTIRPASRNSSSPDGHSGIKRQESGTLGGRRASGGRPSLPTSAPDPSRALHAQRARPAGGGRSTTPVPHDSAAPAPAATGPSIFGREHKAQEKGKKVNVFENGRYCDEGGSRGMWTPCIVARGISDMQVLFNVLTRALGWHRQKDNIYRETGAMAGGREVTKIWAFNGRPMNSPDEVEDGMWIVVGTGNQSYISPMGATTSWTKKTEEARGSSGSPRPYGTTKSGKETLSVFDRLSNPMNFTGTQSNVHGTISSQQGSTRSTGGGLAARSGGVRGRQDNKLAEAKQRAAAKAAGGTGTSTIASRPGTIKSPSSPGGSPGIRTVQSQSGLSDSWDPRAQAATSPVVVGAGTIRSSPGSTWDARAESAGALPVFDESALESMSEADLIAELERGNKKTLAGWQKKELLGKGSFGTVYSGKLVDGTIAAVKCCAVPKDALGELGLLLREVSFMREFDHNRIVRCFGCLYSRGTKEVQIFLQLMPGGSVAGLVQKKGKLSHAESQKYTKQLLEGLLYLHERKVVHRDVKGDNLLLDSQGDAHIADFGTSKQMMDTISANQKGCATMVGTPYWMAPEVIMANPDEGEDGQYGAKADIWSVGCTLVEMLTGQPPWAGQFENMWSAIFHIAQSTEPPPTPADIPAGAKEVLTLCFKRNPSQRPTSFQLLSHDWLK